MEYELDPRLLRGEITEVTDVGVKVAIKGRMGVLTVPRRCVLTDRELAVGQSIEVYLSYVRVL
jgi:hypothetical protein